MKLAGIAAAVALAGLIASGGAIAEPQVYGLGATSCGKFAAFSKASQQNFMDWFAGFASMASGQTGIDYFKGTDMEGRLLWMLNYCRAHPLEMFNDAAVKLMTELHKKQGT